MFFKYVTLFSDLKKKKILFSGTYLSGLLVTFFPLSNTHDFIFEIFQLFCHFEHFFHF